MRAVAIAAVLMLALPAAHADRPSQLPADEIEQLYKAGSYSETLRAGARLIVSVPDDVTVRYYYGLALADVGDLDAAVTQLEEARRRMPDSPEILFALARTVKDETEAARYLATAGKLAPADPQLAELTAHFDTLARARAGTRESFPAGSAEAFAQNTLILIEQGKLEQVVREHMPPGAIAKMLGGASPGGEEEQIRGFLNGLTDAWRANAAQPGTRYEGFRVIAASPPIAPDATSARVTAYLVLARQLGEAETAKLRKMYEDPSTRGMLDPAMVRVLDGLDPPDEDALYARLGRTTTPTPIPIELVLVRTGPGAPWKVTDFATPQFTLSDLIGRIDELATKGLVDAPPRRGGRDWFKIGQGVGRLLGIGIALGVTMWLVARGRRRRKAAGL